jgi:hypothetical protein
MIAGAGAGIKPADAPAPREGERDAGLLVGGGRPVEGS